MSKSKCKRKVSWTEQDFFNATKQHPENDDLERANCKQHGKLGHSACGVCHKHNLPVFMCPICFVN